MGTAAQSPIRLAEELILLMLNEQSGYLEMVPGWSFSCVMAGSVIADLALEDRIDSDLNRLYLVDPTPIGDKLLDSRRSPSPGNPRTRNSGSNGSQAAPRKSSRPHSIAWWRGRSSTTRWVDSGASRAPFHAREPIRPLTSTSARKLNQES